VPFVAPALADSSNGTIGSGYTGGPLLLRSQGSFFVGGQDEFSDGLVSPNLQPPSTTLTPTGTYTVNQMYVHYQVPYFSGRVPIVLIHGCCLTGKSWETTPDGRIGWDDYFVRQSHPTYVIDQVGRGRSGYDPTTINEVAAGTQPISALPAIRTAGHEGAWTLFRFGPVYGQVFANEQFPVEAAAEFWKEIVPDFNGALPTPNPTLLNLSTLAVKLNGAVLISHSESFAFPWQTAVINSAGIAGIVAIEGSCSNQSQNVAVLAKIPTLILFGDHTSDFPNWTTNVQGCQTLVQQVKAAGGDMTLVVLPDVGIFGNSHMMMLDKNNLVVSGLIDQWIAARVERGHRYGQQQ
jgi:hypothetical protein